MGLVGTRGGPTYRAGVLRSRGGFGLKVGEFYAEQNVSLEEMERRVREAGGPFDLKYEWALLTWSQAQDRKQSILEKGQRSQQFQFLGVSFVVGSSAVTLHLLANSIASSTLLWLMVWAAILLGLSLITAVVYGLRINRLGRADFLEPVRILQVTGSSEEWKIKMIAHALHAIRRNAVRIRYAAFWIRLNQQFAFVAMISFLAMITAAILPLDSSSQTVRTGSLIVGALGGLGSYAVLYWRLIRNPKPYPDILDSILKKMDPEQLAPPDRASRGG